MPPGHGKVVLRASDVAGGCDPAGGGCGAVPTADTEACAAGQCPLKGPLARECPAPPPRRPTLGRPIFGSTPSAPPAAQSDALPDAPLGAPPDALHESSELPSPAVLGNADKVEHLTTQIQQLRDALAAAEATILQLRAALSAATAQAHPADPGPAAQLAGGGAQEQHKPNGKCRNRRRHRKRGRRQQPGPEEVGAEAQDPEEPAREGQGAKAAAGADPAPRREQRGEQYAEEQGAAWADDWEALEGQEEELDAAPSQSTTSAPPPPGLQASPAAPEACWICSWCGVWNYHATFFCSSPQCGRPRLGEDDYPAPAAALDTSACCFPDRLFPVGGQHTCSEAGSWPVGPAEALGADCYQVQVGIVAPQCAGDLTPAPPPQRQLPPGRVYAQPVIPMLVPITPACPPPVPEPADPRQALGEELHPRVAGLCPARANMITGMLLERGGSYAQLLIDDAQLLASEVLTAWQVLVAAEGPQSAQPTAPAPAASTPAQAPDSPRGQQKKPYIPSYLRRQPVVPAQPAAPTPAPAPAPPCGRRNEPYVAPFLRRRQRL
eukprot:TRINITY_DN14744_c0_g1_i1.p1 TRINITY_DN14744_c0_g1~~TRINITY_DN14744_c0_g1_i1.p1  ORF type:complete len:577 (+),score=122.40 TRINITY_DN14744_c0_g1_i1:80-1732(+)